MAAVSRFYGVGATTDDGATWSCKLDGAGTVKVRYSKNADLSSSTTSTGVVADANFYAKVTITGLDPHTIYYYEIQVDDVAWTGDIQTTQDGDPPRFTTFPTEGEDATFNIIFWSCATDGTDPKIWRGMASFSPLPLLCVSLGDLFYPDDITFSGLVAEYRANYDKGYNPSIANDGHYFYRHIVLMMSVAFIWDDHCFGGSESDGNFANKANALAAYKESLPHWPLISASDGIWQDITVGNVYCFLLDGRYQRKITRQTGDVTGYEQYPAKAEFNDAPTFNTAGAGTSSTTLVLAAADTPPSTALNYYQSWYVWLKDGSGNNYFRKCTSSTAVASPVLTLDRAVTGLDDTWTYNIKDATILDADGGTDQVSELIARVQATAARYVLLFSGQPWGYDIITDDNPRRLDPETFEVRYIMEALLESRSVNTIVIASGDAHRSGAGKPGTHDGRAGVQEYHPAWELMSSPADRGFSTGFGDMLLGKNTIPPSSQDPVGSGRMFGRILVRRTQLVASAYFGGDIGAGTGPTRVPTIAPIVLGAQPRMVTLGGGLIGG